MPLYTTQGIFVYRGTVVDKQHIVHWRLHPLARLTPRANILVRANLGDTLVVSSTWELWRSPRSTRRMRLFDTGRITILEKKSQ